MTHSIASVDRSISATGRVRDIEFGMSKYGRGYERRSVDEFVAWTQQTLDTMQAQLDAAQSEVRRLQQRVIDGPHEEEVVQAVHIISNAQRTADGIVAEADAYSARVMSEARKAYDDASRRGARLEQEAEDNVRRLTVESQMHQGELDKQTAYLRTLRDATRTQMEKFLAGMLDHVSSEFGRAHPIAADAAVSPDPAPSQDVASEPSEPSPTDAAPSGAATNGAPPNGAEPVDVHHNGMHPATV